jgi:hypothetical protein
MDESSVPEIIGLPSYQELAQHEDKATALTHAKLDLLRHYRDLSPYYFGRVCPRRGGLGLHSIRLNIGGYHTQACFHQPLKPPVHDRHFVLNS